MTTKTLQKIISILKDGLLSIYLYQKDSGTIPVFVVQEVDFVFLASISDYFVDEKFILLTQDDILQGKDVFCLKLLHIKNHSELFYGKDILGGIDYKKSDIRAALELEIRNKRIHLRESYLSALSQKEFLKHLLPGMQILWESALVVKDSSLHLPKDIKELLALFDVAWSCNSQIFYYLIDGEVEKKRIPSLVQEVHGYLSDVCIKINNFIS